MILAPRDIEIRHWHVFCGLGGGARGFNAGRAKVGHAEARFRCIGGVDSDAAAIRDFGRLAGVPGTVLDLFDREQYRAFHGQEPPDGWREATVDDIRRSAGGERPHLVFGSAPCKGFSGLLSESRSGSARYQALNQLALRGLWLALEAWSDDPPEFFLWENVPRIATRGRPVLDKMRALFDAYGYISVETTHDCGELGWLAQSRKRFLLVARHRAKVPPFLYEPDRRPLRAVGEVLGPMPLPGDPAAGPMHAMRELQWKTWVRLAFVEAGGDWRSLQRLRVEGGVLADYGIAPEAAYFPGVYGVTPWDTPSTTVTGAATPNCGRFSVADPRPAGWDWTEGRRGLGVTPWDESAETVTSQSRPGQGAHAVADPRMEQSGEYGQLGVRRWDEPSGAVSGQSEVGGGRYAVADPRLQGERPRYNNVYRIVRWNEPAQAVTAGGGPSAGGQAVADPRPATEWSGKGKYRVTRYDEPAGTVIAASTTGNGAFAVADPRPDWARRREGGADWQTPGHYGVVPWDSHALAVTGSASPDNGRFSVADPRAVLPVQDARLVAVIRALDGTWHRPFTTLELAALQGLVDPDVLFLLAGRSDSGWRERIGNAVPSPTAAAIASVMGTTLLLAWAGETFVLSASPIWVRPLVVALAVDLPELPA